MESPHCGEAMIVGKQVCETLLALGLISGKTARKGGRKNVRQKDKMIA